jgi:creatinine amidohydrolase
MTSVLWSELTAEELRAKAASDAVVVLPVASMEQHGPHLPVGVDTILCERVCKAAAERVDGTEVVVAPTVWCGMAEHHMAFGGTFTFDIPTYRADLLCLLKCLERHGFRRVVIVNGHGGNNAALTAFLPDFARQTKLRVHATTYFAAVDKIVLSILEDQTAMMHACEVETSMMMALVPELVKYDRLQEAYGGQEPERQAAPIFRRTARHRSFKDKTDSGVHGDARRASDEKGAALVEACVKSLAAMLSHKRV